MKRIFALFLALVLLVGSIPVNAYATETEEPTVTETTVETEAPTTEPPTTEPPTTEPPTTEPPTTEPPTTEAPTTEPPTTEPPTTEAPTTEPPTTEPPTSEPPTTEPPTTEPPTTEPPTEETIPQESTAPDWVAGEVCVAPDPGLPGNDELFAAYAESVFYGNGFSFFGTAAGARLSGDEKVLYDALVPIIKQIAAGTRASTLISIGQTIQYEGQFYIPEVSAVFTGASLSDASLYRVLDALLSDLPFELYWYDKVTGAYAFYYGDTTLKYVEFLFTVADNYAADNYYTVNTAKTGAAANAAANARSIVSKYAGKTDYEKLVGYKNEICNLVSYDVAAAEGGYFSENNDPWQLIHVFDGNSSTNVVCEGYAKAFMYLCDLTSFSGEVVCYTVTGTMADIPHMWNIVTIEGDHYLVDITNSDSGAIGQDGGLFLVGGLGNPLSGYTFLDVPYCYDEVTTNFWGTGSDSILFLATANYGDATQKVPKGLKFTISNDTVTITGYTGTEKELTIPKTIYGYPVTAIGYRAFYRCKNLVSIIIPESVISFGEGAFENCENLTNLEIPDSVTSIGKDAFNNCRSLTSITIPDGVTCISESAFSYCYNLKTINIPNSVKSIGESAFYGCESLTSIKIPDDVIEIAPSLFSGCKSLTSIKIPSGVTSIGVSAFSGCSGLTSINIPNGVTNINNYTFSGCTNLEMITLPNGVTSIGDSAFSECYSLQSINIPAGVTQLGSFAFNWCIRLTSVTLPNSLTTVGNYTFYLCEDLTSVTLPSRLTSIGNSMFNGCRSLTSITIPDSVQTIGDSAFYLCESLTSIRIPDGVAGIGNQTFFNCVNLTSISISDSVTSIGNDAFEQCASLTSITIPSSVTNIGYDAFNECSSLTKIFFEGSTPVFENNCFYNVTATAYYPAGDSTWTDEVKQKYGSTLTWVAKTPLKIATQPKSMTAAEGSRFSTKVVATGDGLSYAWYYKNAGASSYTKSSVTSNTYSGTMQSNWAGRQIYCKVSDKYGSSITTDVITLTLGNPIKITTQPKNITAPSGSKITTKVEATGDGLTYQWYFKNAGATSYTKSSVTSATYSGTMQSSWSGRKIYCKITDKYGNSVTTNVVTLTAGNPATITTQPKNMTVPVGSRFSTKVVATGDGLTYQWYFKNAGASSFTKSSVTSATYSGTMQSSWSGRQIYCRVTDQYGNGVNTSVITLTAGNPAKITGQPKNVVVPSGGKISTKVTATGDGLSYQWYFKNAGASSYSKSSVTGATYTATMQSNWDGRQMYCKVTDKYGNSVNSNVITFYIGNPATITTQPKSMTAVVGSRFSTKVVATGDGLSYQWYYKNAGATSYTKSSVTGNTYSGTMVTSWGGRQIYCKITDKYGNSVTTNVITLTLAEPVKITTQPKSVVVPVGGKISTKVVATGDGLTYQWYYKNASASSYSKSSITGATYTATMKSTWDGRKMYCKVTDKYGNTVTSETVTFTIGNPVKITTQPKSMTVAVGDRFSTKVVATGDGLKYQWYYKNAGATSYTKSSVTSATYSGTMVTSWGGREIYCVVTDQYGNSVKTNTITLKIG